MAARSAMAVAIWDLESAFAIVELRCLLLVLFVHFGSCDLGVLKPFTRSLQGENTEKSKNFGGFDGIDAPPPARVAIVFRGPARPVTSAVVTSSAHGLRGTA